MKLPRALLPSLLITLPRTAAVYPFYGLATILLIGREPQDYRAYIKLLVLGLLIFASFTLRYLGNGVSVTAFILEVVLLTPLLLFASGFKPALNETECLYSIRLINLICFLSSLCNLMREGFPLLLPYVNFLPDAYFGTFGIGGARIVTIFGIVGLLFEATTTSRGKYWPIWCVIALLNFFVPSYMLGIACGMVAMLFLLKKRPALLLVIFALSIPMGYYFVDRLYSLNSVMYETVGVHPKIYAYLLVYELLSQSQLNFLVGTGLGQFTSSPQIWSSDEFRGLSVQSAPYLPGLHTSEFYQSYLEPVSSVVYVYPKALSSAANKPYTGFTTLIAEMGLSSLFLLYLLTRRVFSIFAANRLSISFFAFFVLINLVDQWVDNLWLGYCLMLAAGFYDNGVAKEPAGISGPELA